MKPEDLAAIAMLAGDEGAALGEADPASLPYTWYQVFLDSADEPLIVRTDQRDQLAAGGLDEAMADPLTWGRKAAWNALHRTNQYAGQFSDFSAECACARVVAGPPARPTVTDGGD